MDTALEKFLASKIVQKQLAEPGAQVFVHAGNDESKKRFSGSSKTDPLYSIFITDNQKREAVKAGFKVFNVEGATEKKPEGVQTDEEKKAATEAAEKAAEKAAAEKLAAEEVAAANAAAEAADMATTTTAATTTAATATKASPATAAAAKKAAAKTAAAKKAGNS